MHSRGYSVPKNAFGAGRRPKQCWRSLHHFPRSFSWWKGNSLSPSPTTPSHSRPLVLIFGDKKSLCNSKIFLRKNPRKPIFHDTIAASRFTVVLFVVPDLRSLFSAADGLAVHSVAVQCVYRNPAVAVPHVY